MSTPPMVVPLTDAVDIELVGGKAVNLAQMLNAGLPVPNGFVVTTTAYRRYEEETELPASLSQAIRSAYKAMGEPLVAARSSATAEDRPDASMAGQYDTYLNLGTADDLIEAIRKCWASVKGDRITSYLQEHGISVAQVAMAVVVQELVHADCAGVLFTCHPRTGAMDEMLIEGSWGLGEALVSGDVQPDVIRVGYESCEVRAYQVSDKQQQLRPGGVGMEPVPETLQKKACLNYNQIQQLWRIGQRAVKHFQGPQDMEWAFVENQLYVLQARPITTLEDVQAYHQVLANAKTQLQEAAHQGRGPWVRHNLSETLPHPTELTWSVVSQFMSGAGGFGLMHKDVGFEPSDLAKERGFLERIAGQVYMDCSRLPEMFCRDYPFAYDVDLLRTNPDAAQQPPTIAKGTFSQLAAAGKLGARVTEKLHGLARDLDAQFEGPFVANLLAWCTAQDAIKKADLDNLALFELWDAQQRTVMDEFGKMAFLPSMVEALATAECRAFLDEHVWDEDPDELLHCLSVSPKADLTLLANIELAELADGTRTLDAWLTDHGHRGPGEFDLASPRWSERPDELKQMAEPLKGNQTMGALHEQRVEQARACVDRLKQALKPSLRATLSEHVDLLQRYCQFRENGKYYLMKAYAVLRQTALEMGRRLGVDEAVFFLRPDEIKAALHTGFVPEDRIRQRRRWYAAESRVRLSHVIEAKDIATLGSPPQTSDDLQWQGFAISCGVNSGPARIVHSPEAATDLGRDYILVCPSTDPSWTPLFVNAAGLILERGGSLSHGAIVARELGLPAVVLEGATDIFTEGEVLNLDGGTGRIGRQGDDPLNVSGEDDPDIERHLCPPIVSQKERASGKWGLMAAIVWGVFLGAVYGLPSATLKDPLFTLMDHLLWPLIPRIGMVWTVALVGSVFAIVPLLIQRYATDNDRLYAAKKRSNVLQKLANKLPKESPRRLAMEQAAKPVSTRLLKASMTALAFIIGPMMMVFLWFPERVDPAVWNAEPGRSVYVVAELNGDTLDPVTLACPNDLMLVGEATQVLPPIRQTLIGLRDEWQAGSDVSQYPWELQAAADHTRELLLASLNQYLASDIPAQKLTWTIQVPAEAKGHYPVSLAIGPDHQYDVTLAFGNQQPPVSSKLEPDDQPLYGLEVVYPRALIKPVFWVPLASIGGPGWDMGWLGVYIVAYLGMMVLGKYVFRVP
ncbi:MAG: hypothetical protein K9N55_14035 [Phycisphaerae bacterium]|nr:hypothetical protein [Phycisphaerae bacterium]